VLSRVISSLTVGIPNLTFIGYEIQLLQGDQKVSVHLMITLHIQTNINTFLSCLTTWHNVTAWHLQRREDMNSNSNILNPSCCTELVSRHLSGAIYCSGGTQFFGNFVIPPSYTFRYPLHKISTAVIICKLQSHSGCHYNSAHNKCTLCRTCRLTHRNPAYTKQILTVARRCKTGNRGLRPSVAGKTAVGDISY
jgi:hypothetical protein